MEFKKISGHSMEPFLHPGEVVLIHKTAYGIRLGRGFLVRWGHPRIGEVVAARHPLDKKTIIKRCLAREGDSLEIGKKDLVVHGIRIEGKNLSRVLFPEVPGGTLLLIGDNRDNSEDSRHFGFLPEENLIGRVYRIGFLK